MGDARLLVNQMDKLGTGEESVGISKEQCNAFHRHDCTKIDQTPTPPSLALRLSRRTETDRKLEKGKVGGLLSSLTTHGVTFDTLPSRSKSETQMLDF